jgi:uncharacterized membrane protein YdcZ (DUF606 family)
MPVCHGYSCRDWAPCSGPISQGERCEFYLCVFSLLAGAILPLQAALNAGLAGRTTGSLFSTFINFSSGIIAIAAALVVLRV